MLLQREAFARTHDNALHLVTVRRFEYRIRAPRAIDRLRYRRQVRTSGLEFIDNLFHLLAARKRSDQQSIRRIDDQHVVEVNRTNLTLTTQHERVLGTNTQVLCVYVVAIFVMVVFTIEGIERTKIRPADITRNNLHLRRLFHHGIVNRVRRNVHHVVMIDTDKSTLVLFLGICKSNLRCGQNIRRELRKFIKERRSLETEDPAIPEEPSRSDILLGGFQVRLFDKTLDVIAIRFDVAITSFRARRRNPERNHETLFSKSFGLA